MPQAPLFPPFSPKNFTQFTECYQIKCLCAKTKNYVVTREAIDLQVLFDYDTTSLKTSIKLHIISLKIKLFALTAQRHKGSMLAMHLNPSVAGSCSWPVLNYCILKNV